MTIDRSACPGRRHGTANAYRNHGCRCEDARRANRIHSKRLAAGLIERAEVSPIGAVRRRQALAAMGYGLPDLAPYFGVTRQALACHLKSGLIHRDTHRRWVEVYDLLSMTPGPSEKARAYARRMGWVPPLAWDDEDLDRPDGQPVPMPKVWKHEADLDRISQALAGDRSAQETLRPADRTHIVRALHADGLSDYEIARRSGISHRGVRYIRSRLCLPAVPQREQAKPNQQITAA